VKRTIDRLAVELVFRTLDRLLSDVAKNMLDVEL
jgi:hypothetical protein